MAIDPKRVKEIFLAVLDLPDSTARAQYLDRVCGGDTALRARVEALLRSHDAAGSFLGTPVAVVPDPNRGETMALDPIPVPGSTRDGGGKPGPEQDEESDDLPFLTPSTRPDSLGRLGHYEVLQVLGRGGFGIVFRAFDDVLQRVVAVKVMAPQIATLSPARKRFLREARSSAAVRHENVVQVYEVGEQPLPYLVMEFIPGETLQQKLDRSGPLDVPEVLRIGRQIAEGLAAAHACDLIHRDIKPGNILLEGGSHKAKITDFGLARAADDASISQSGVIAGTPMFMAPEQALGHHIDQRADLFSLGSVLYQMASGRPPFRAPSALAVLKRVAEEPPRSIHEIIPETPDWLCGIIAKLHAKKPDDRFQSAREVADLLADCEAKLKAKQEASIAIPGEPSRVSGRVERPAASSRWMKWAAAAVLLLPVIALTVTELAGVTQLFRGQATTDPIKQRSEPTPPIQGANNQTPDKDGWVQLFNRKDLTGWKSHPEQRGTWDVRDGILIGSARQSHLFTERADFANFHLRAEMKINEGRDSGIRFRTPFKLLRGEQAWQVIPFGGYEAEFTNLGAASAQSGSVWRVNQAAPPNTLFRATDKTLTRPDEWYDYEIIADGNRFITKIDGREVANCVDPDNTYPIGHIALQCFSAQTVVQFRKIEIKELSPVLVAKKEVQPTFTNSIGMEFVIVPKGKSWLGGGKDKLGDKEVEIPADFYLGKYEVTQEEWEKVMGENPSRFSRAGEGMDAVKDIPGADLKRFPVERVSWDQCQVFVAKINKLEKETGWVYRLPKIVEWEYACRGGPMANERDSAYDFYLANPTNTLLPDQANFNLTGLKRSCKVGSYTPNLVGLFDMHGNVLEWCEDSYTSAIRKPLRGGSWADDAPQCKLMFNGAMEKEGQMAFVGLRLARVPSGAASPEVKTPPVAVAPFAYFRFAGNDKNDGNGVANFELRNTEFKDNALYLNGKYEYYADKDGYRAVCKTPNLDYNTFTVAIRFKAEDFRSPKTNLITGGKSYRWFGMGRSNAGNLAIFMNAGSKNNFFHHEIKGATLDEGKWTLVACAVDLPKRKILAYLNGKKAAEIELPKDFQLEVANSPERNLAKDWSFANESSGNVFHGLVDGLLIYNRALSPQELEKIDFVKEPLPPPFKNNLGMEFVKVPKGKSWLGGGKDKLGDKEVTIPADFYLGKYEVTQEEWEKVMGENPSHFSRAGKGMDAVKDISDADLRQFPIEEVSWDQCQIFVAKLNKLEKETGWVYRLPKEAEWEYACRGGPMSDKLDSAFDFYFAKSTNTLLPEQANFGLDKGLNRTCNVGRYEANRLGLFDMHGNVWEWCEDTEKVGDGASHWVYRGGCWFVDSGYCRAASRFTEPPSHRHHALGLRLARVPSGAPSPEVKTTP